MNPPAADALLDAAVAHHTAGRLAEAEPLYRSALTLDPAHADALHLLGLLLYQTNRSSEAEPLVRRAIGTDPNQAAFHTHLGLIVASLGGDPIEYHHRAVAIDSTSADAHGNLGVALAATGRTDDAIGPLQRAVAIRPDVTALDNLARSLHAAGRSDEAVDAYRQAIATDPQNAQLHADLGHVLRASNRLDEGIAAHRRSAELMPASPVPLDNLGSALQRAGRVAEAMATYAAALAIQPGRPQTLNHVGTVHADAGRWAEARAAFEAALVGQSDFADAINNLGTVLEELGDRDAAMAHYRRAVALAPTGSSGPWNLALMHLLRGEYEHGWPGYEHRWRQPLSATVYRRFAQPMWDRSDLAGRTLLLHAEQGLGDAIQFARYAPLAARRGGPVVVECHPPLVRLFRSLAGVSAVVARGDVLPPFDVHCPLMSLPMVFGTAVATVPADVPYMRGDDAAWRDRLAAEPPGLRVGLVWAGDARHQKDRDRSLHRSMLAPLADVPGVRFYSLQLGEPAKQAGGPAVVDWTADLTDMAATAGLVSQLDLVITPDTAVAHLSGALGRPTWVLVPFAPDWRWLLNRDDSPWYPSARLFRQDGRGDWAAPVSRLAAALAAWARP